MAKKQKKQPSQGLQRLDRPLSLVAQAEQTLRRAIAEGVYPGDRLPTTVQLAEQLGVSRETVRLALESLQQDGLIVKHRRRGTFFNPTSVPTELTHMPMILGYLQADYSPEHGEAEMITRTTSSVMFDGALVEAGNAGYQLLVRSSRIGDLRASYQQLCDQARLRGVLFASIAEEKFLRRIAAQIPAVLMDHDLNLPMVSSIMPDTYGRARMCVQHLAELGHRRIALAQILQDDLNPWFLRGYREGMRDQGLRCRRVWEQFARITRAGVDEMVDALLATSPRPTAVICFSNTMANFLIEAAWARGVSVPEELSVIGGGGGDVVGLTCAQLDWYDLGRQAMRMLLQAIDSGEAHKPEHRLLPYQIQPGRTTGRLDGE